MVLSARQPLHSLSNRPFSPLFCIPFVLFCSFLLHVGIKIITIYSLNSNNLNITIKIANNHNVRSYHSPKTQPFSLPQWRPRTPRALALPTVPQSLLQQETSQVRAASISHANQPRPLLSAARHRTEDPTWNRPPLRDYGRIGLRWVRSYGHQG